MTRATELSHPIRTAAWTQTPLGYPCASVVVGVARNQDDLVTTGRDEGRAAR